MASLISPLSRSSSASRETFVEAMSKVASTVHVVTTDGPFGRAGMTVTAMTSVSVNGTAPTLLVCLNRSGRAGSVILRNGCFCVNVLRDDQARVSDAFAGKVTFEDGDKFSSATWVPAVSGSPRLIDALCAFDCRVLQAQRVGTHHVVIGAVSDVITNSEGAPLIYVDRDYWRPESREINQLNEEMNNAYDNAA